VLHYCDGFFVNKLNLILFFILLLGFVFSYESLQGPTEVIFWDQENAYDGFTLFASGGTTYLIDMAGRVVNNWEIGKNPRFLDNGNLFDSAKNKITGKDGFKELDWDGNVVWEYYEDRNNYYPHHDFTRAFNKKLGEYTTFYIANKDITNEECIENGCDPKYAPYLDAQMDTVVEVDMQGNVIWEWRFIDHVIQDIDSTKKNYVGEGKTIADYPEKININLPGKPLRKDWLHCNSMDYSEELDQIMINAVSGEFYVIDHGATFVKGDPKESIALAAGPLGDFLYRFGDPARYGQGDPPSLNADWVTPTTGNKQMGGTHDIQWIRKGLPGEGHLLVFNNGQYLFDRTSQSSILEINPYLNSNGIDTGKYVNPPEAGYKEVEFDTKNTHKTVRIVSNQIVWSYIAQSNQGFFSHIGSSAQRLPNGNTLICSDTEGHLFEVTKDGNLVWEYINPVTTLFGIVEVMPDAPPMTNAVFRAYRYDKNHPALKDKTLVPGKTITGAEAKILLGLNKVEDTTEQDFCEPVESNFVSQNGGNLVYFFFGLLVAGALLLFNSIILKKN